MAAAGLPIDVTHVFDLPTLGIAPDAINFRSLTLAGDTSMCVVNKEEGNVYIVDTASGRVANKIPMRADAAVLNKDAKNIAVRGGEKLQIYNLEVQRKVKEAKMPAGQNVVYWTWISGSTVAIVTNTSCYHWSMDGAEPPAKMFDRDASLEGTQVINYQTSVDGKWLMVVGIKGGASGVEGAMQLYSLERKVSQALTSHASTFCTAKVAGRSDPAILFCFVEKKPGANPRLFIMEVGRAPGAPGGVFRLPPQDLPVPPEAVAGNDFPVSLQVSKKHDILYIFTKMGFVYLYDVHTGAVLFRHRMTDQSVFVTALHQATSGVLAVTAKTGQVMLVRLNEGNLIPYIVSTLRNNELAMGLATRLGLAGADGLYVAQFNELFAAGNYEGAAKIAAKSPGDTLRNSETITRFQSLPTPPGQQPPVLKYFAALMEQGKLNKVESVELARPALQQGKPQLVEKWLSEDKVECSEMLGDLVAPYNAALALQVYLRSGEAHEKVINCYMSTGEIDKIVPYANKHGYVPNYPFMLQNLVHANPKAAQELASQLYRNEGGPLIEVNQVIEIFMQFNRLQETTSFLLDVLAGDREEEGALQTRLLEMNLQGGAPQVADAILSRDMFHHFDRDHVAKLCEQAALFNRALELFTDVNDIKRVIVNTHAISAEFLETFFGTMTPENCLECLNELLTVNIGANLQVVVKVATKYTEHLMPERLIALFEEHDSFDGLYYYLGSIVNASESPAVHYKYIVAAAKLNQFKEVERVCRDSQVYDAEEVKTFLLDAKLPDPRPLIHVCDRHGYVDELTTYLFSNGLKKFIEVYVQKVAPAKTPQVVGRLLDLDCDEDFIKALITSVRAQCPVGPLVEEVEARSRLRLLQQFLEQRVTEGATDADTHNAVGKIYIMQNKDPQQFLTNNPHYDSAVVGKFCEKLDPFLAFIAYRRGAGSCDEQLIEVTNANGLFKDQARYLVERQDEELWARVLTTDNPHRRSVIDQVSGTALPETKDPEMVSNTVKAFMQADLPDELLSLLEKLVLQGGDFAKNKNLQNLLILTAIKCSNREDAEEGRAMKYIERLDNFDGPEIAKIAVREEYQLFEEAFAIYKKFDNHVEAAGVLIDHIGDLARALEFANRVDDPEVWSRLARAQLTAGEVKAAIDSFIKANDAAAYKDVTAAAQAAGKYDDLVRFLQMARKKLKERFVDTELVYALAQTERLGDLEIFITGSHVAQIEPVGDRLFAEGKFEAARVLFNSINSNAKLAACHVRLGAFRDAVDAARKASSTRTWKMVNAACVEAGEFRLAQICGLNIIVNPDHLEELITLYERLGHFEEVIKLLEQGLGLESAHQGIFTELSVLYSKYRADKLMEHLKYFWSRVNVSKVLRACEANLQWKEATFLYTETKEYDNAVRIMIEHSSEAFSADKFVEVIQKVRNTELYYRAINFYLEEEPAELGRLLSVLTPKLDHTRVVHQMRHHRDDQLPLVVEYLQSVQAENLSAVNEALNELYVDDENFTELRRSIEEFDNFDQIALAQKIEKNELLEFRRIAAFLYKQNKRWETSINLSKADKIYKDAIDTCADSRDPELAEALLRYFVDNDEKECFCAALYTCYDLIKPDVALELAWRHRLTDFVMPFVIQYVREVDTRLAELDARTRPDEGKEEEAARAAAEAAAYGYAGPPMLAATAYNPAVGMDGAAAGYGAAAPGYGMPPGGGGMY
uniref:Clathrin heavy chain n=2 Tax=Bicosoecida sp. CB-2014 TaxID=1486930 RepID=A0A7S1G8A3_9STRA